MLNIVVILGAAAGGIYLVSKIFGEKTAGDMVRIPLEAAGKAMVEAGKYALQELAGIYLQGADVIAIVAMMAKESAEQYHYDKDMRETVIPGRCKSVHDIAAKVSDSGILLMDDLAYLVAFRKEYLEVAVPSGYAHTYDSSAFADAVRLITFAQNGVIPTVYNADLAFKVIHDKALKDYTVQGKDFVYIQDRVNAAVGARMTPGKGVPDSQGRTRPWLLILSNKVIEKGKEFIEAVNDGTIKQI